jgi:hypothetical protein
VARTVLLSAQVCLEVSFVVGDNEGQRTSAALFAEHKLGMMPFFAESHFVRRARISFSTFSLPTMKMVLLADPLDRPFLTTVTVPSQADAGHTPKPASTWSKIKTTTTKKHQIADAGHTPKPASTWSVWPEKRQPQIGMDGTSLLCWQHPFSAVTGRMLAQLHWPWPPPPRNG